jgi:hypothetical protein
VSEQDDEKSEETERPWDQPGQERRDCLPGRGGQLDGWAWVGLMTNSVSCCIFPGLLFGIPLCILVAVVAQKDLAEIRARTRSLRGEIPTLRARNKALIGLGVGFLALLLWGWEILSHLLP